MLITVPCCEACRTLQPLDDEYFVQMLAMKSDIRETDSSRDARNAALRALSKPSKVRSTHALLRSVEDVDTYSPAGLYLGKRFAYDVNLDRLCNVIERTVAGLHLKEFKTRIPEGHRCKAYALDGFAETSSSVTLDVSTLWQQATSGQRSYVGSADVFTYWCREIHDLERVSMWAFVIYGRVGFMALTGPSDQIPG